MVVTAIKEMLIQAVSENPAIWDISHPDHYKSDINLSCWQKIEEKLKQCFGAQLLGQHKMGDPSSIKKVWMNLRSNYRSSKSRNKGKSGAGLTDVAQKKWHFFEQMQFLEESNVTFEHVSSLGNPSVAGEDISAGSELVLIDPVTFGLSTSQEQETAIPDGINTVEVKQEDGRNTASKGWTRLDQRKRKVTDQISKNEDRARRTDAFVAAASAFSNAKHDECTAFGNLVSAKMTKVPEDKRTEAEIYILQYLDSFK